jgi:hypothetical protein
VTDLDPLAGTGSGVKMAVMPWWRKEGEQRAAAMQEEKRRIEPALGLALMVLTVQC